MSTAELAATREHRPAVTPERTAVTPDSIGGPVNGVPAKRGEQLLRRAGAPRGGTSADKAPDLLEEFAAIVAHELRTPLAIVGLGADTVLERTNQLEPDQLAGMLWIIQCNTRLATLLSNAAQYSPQGSYIDVTVVQGQDEARITRARPRLRAHRSGRRTGLRQVPAGRS